MKKKGIIAGLSLVFAAFVFVGCNNLFHDLLPPPDNDIISFAVQFSDGSRSASSNAITNQVVTVTVPDGTDLTNLIPVVTVSEKATVIPGTLPYLNKVFPERDLMHLAVQMNNAFKDGTFKDWFLKIVMETPKVSIPRLDMPVDFSVPVYFCVISGNGNYKLYTVNVLTETEKIIEETGETPSAADNFILSFEVPGQRGTSEIIHEGIDSSLSGTVDFVVEQGTNIRSLLPAITVSEGAKIIPLTMEYIMNCGFTFDQMLGFYTGFSTATDVEKYVSSFLRRATNIVYPEITTPMDFSSSVPFAVVGSDGGVRVYNANCSVYDGTPKLEKVYFSKVNNPYLLKDFECENSLDSFIGQATYPDEMELDYGLIPDIVFIGEKATYSINGGAETEIVSGVTVIPFTSGNRTCAITVYRDGNTKTYNLTVEKVFDPDTIRSITDYRFKKQNNSDIKNTVIASIYNEGDTGYISATVLYEGSTAPYDLVVDFISPGTVTTADTIEGAVPGTVQSSGVTSNNFQYSRKFLCTSRNGLYTRLYTVNIEFVQVVPAEVAIKSFAFPVYLNGDLSQDAVATINDADGSIRCQVTYASENVPKNLVAEFSATGAVTCSGITQTSGYTANNFTYSQYYTVTVQDEYYGTLTKNYKVEVVFIKDNDSACELLTFGFATEDNPTLTSDVNATVTQRNGSVYAFMPFGAGATEGKALVPYFTAEGTVTVNGARQTSGASGQDFSSPVTYTVTSANGRYTKDYTVTLQESGAVIYVDCEAYGLNNGTSWQDAFISLDKALEQAAYAPEEVVQELWVAAREEDYIPIESSGFKMRPNLIIRGGFNGTEKAIEEREKDIDGNLVKRTGLKSFQKGKSTSLFSAQFLYDTIKLEGLETTVICDECPYASSCKHLSIIYVEEEIPVTENFDISFENSHFIFTNASSEPVGRSYFLKFQSVNSRKHTADTFKVENCYKSSNRDFEIICNYSAPSVEIDSFTTEGDLLFENGEISNLYINNSQLNEMDIDKVKSIQINNSNFYYIKFMHDNNNIESLEITNSSVNNIYNMASKSSVCDSIQDTDIGHLYIDFRNKELTISESSGDQIRCYNYNSTISDCNFTRIDFDKSYDSGATNKKSIIQNCEIDLLCAFSQYDIYFLSLILDNSFFGRIDLGEDTDFNNLCIYDCTIEEWDINDNYSLQVDSLLEICGNNIGSYKDRGRSCFMKFNGNNSAQLKFSNNHIDVNSKKFIIHFSDFNKGDVNNNYFDPCTSIYAEICSGSFENNSFEGTMDLTIVSTGGEGVYVKDNSLLQTDKLINPDGTPYQSSIINLSLQADVYFQGLDFRTEQVNASSILMYSHPEKIKFTNLTFNVTQPLWKDSNTSPDFSIYNNILRVIAENCHFPKGVRANDSDFFDCIFSGPVDIFSSETISDCTFTNCSSSRAIVDTSSLEDCVFYGCTVTSDRSVESIVYSNPALSTIKGCQFYDNKVVVSSDRYFARGGIVYFKASESSEENPSYSLENCTFKGNQLVCKLEKTQAEHTFNNDHGGVCVAVDANKDNTTLRLKDCVFEDSRLYYEFTDGTVSPENKNPNHIWMSANYSNGAYNECKIILEGTNTYDTLNGTLPVYLNGVDVEGSWQ